MLRRKAFTLKLWDKIGAHCRKHRLFRDGDPVLLAVSGGPDSVMMLDFFSKLARSRRLKLAIAHLNHKLRGADSDRDEAFVKKLGAAYGLPVFTAKADVAASARRHKLSVEHAARRSRYDFLAKLALKKKCDGIVGIGGGSAMDLAKAIAVLATNKGKAEDYLGLNRVPGPGLPKIMVPTTAGTGSEVTLTAVFIRKKLKKKEGMNSPYLYPELALLDPELTLSLRLTPRRRRGSTPFATRSNPTPRSLPHR